MEPLTVSEPVTCPCCNKQAFTIYERMNGHRCHKCKQWYCNFHYLYRRYCNNCYYLCNFETKSEVLYGLTNLDKYLIEMDNFVALCHNCRQ